MGIETGTALIIAAAVGAAAAAGTTVYNTSAAKTAAKHEEEFQKDLIAQQDKKVTDAENKAKGAETQAAMSAQEKLKKQRMAQTQSILTSPLGIDEQAQTGAKSLLGG